ncbi:MAG: hypothetical protein ACK5JM_08805, partial [Rhodoblastus sp.]
GLMFCALPEGLAENRSPESPDENADRDVERATGNAHLVRNHHAEPDVLREKLGADANPASDAGEGALAESAQDHAQTQRAQNENAQDNTTQDNTAQDKGSHAERGAVIRANGEILRLLRIARLGPALTGIAAVL